ncbi:MAG: dTDP-glucose 4,6-dehydratase [Armatimonadetes bacterium]|nr:dTDP-glucose 4,6-dehydratase [Armatimonadota bacterium]
MKLLVTGGAGFIGSNFLNRFVSQNPEIQFLNLDALTYAGNPQNLVALNDLPNYLFYHCDLRDAERTREIVQEFQPTHIIHFAAESHVDRSITGPQEFLESNILGTFNLLQAAKELWQHNQTVENVFHHVSTDEVYGSLGAEGLFQETTPYDPRSPYSASKAASDHIVRAYYHTFHLPVKITNCSNNYGPYQFPEKLIPVIIQNATAGKPIPIYGDGLNVRDWLHVNDHCDALWTVMTKGKVGETYNIGGNSERTNLQVVHEICSALAEQTDQPIEKYTDLITFVTDRPGHDRRYAIDATKIKTELGWSPSITFEEGIRQTVAWYLQNQPWIDAIKDGTYQNIAL